MILMATDGGGGCDDDGDDDGGRLWQVSLKSTAVTLSSFRTNEEDERISSSLLSGFST